MTRCIVEAIKRSGVYAILSKGWSDRLQTKKSIDPAEPEFPLPSQIYPIKAIPHDWLFKRIEAACHHGGAGTTGASLRAGIPTIIKPFFGDQFFWGDRVEALGVGTCVRKLTVDSLTEALTLATTDEKQIERARHVGEQIRNVRDLCWSSNVLPQLTRLPAGKRRSDRRRINLPRPRICAVSCEIFGSPSSHFRFRRRWRRTAPCSYSSRNFSYP